jgi:hypothetical protein
MNTIQGYMGDPVHAAPPSGPEWVPIDRGSDELDAAAVSLMGDLPAYHSTDRMLSSGLYRFFAFETPVGNRISALRFAGTMGVTQDTGSTTDGSGSDTAGGPATSPGILTQNPFPTQMTAPTDIIATPQGTSDSNPTSSESVGGGTQQVGPASNSTGGGTTTTHEVVPPPNPTCGAWVASTSNAQIVAVANSISYSNSPVVWTDQAVYYTKASDGSQWALAQWWEGGSKMVAAYTCSQPVAAGSGSSMSTGEKIGLAIAGVGAVAGIAFAAFGAHKRSRRA